MGTESLATAAAVRFSFQSVSVPHLSSFPIPHHNCNASVDFIVTTGASFDVRTLEGEDAGAKAAAEPTSATRGARNRMTTEKGRGSEEQTQQWLSIDRVAGFVLVAQRRRSALWFRSLVVSEDRASTKETFTLNEVTEHVRRELFILNEK